MAYISYNRLWETEFDNTVSRRDKLQHMKINQLDFEVHATYKKDENIATNFETTDDPDVINKVYVDAK